MPVYLVGVVDGCHKIGMSKNPRKRAEEWAMLPSSPRIVHIIKTDFAEWLESYLHTAFADRRVRGEWFKLDRPEVKALKQIKRADFPVDLPEWIKQRNAERFIAMRDERILPGPIDYSLDRRMSEEESRAFLGGISKAELRRMVQSGRLKQRTCFLRSDLVEFIESMPAVKTG